MSWTSYALTLVVFYSIYVIVTSGLNLVTGYCGRLTLAHGALYGVGAYAYALCTIDGRMPPYPALLVAVIAGAVFSLPLSVPERRLRGDFFVIGSLALQAMVFAGLRNWQTPGEPIGSWSNLTNGTVGITGVPRPAVFGTGLAAIAVLAALSAGLTLTVIASLVRSPWGRIIRASRDDRLVAEGLAKPVFRARVQAFAVSGASAALGGALYAGYATYVSPDVGSLDVSVRFLTMSLVGGANSLVGPLVGAAALLGMEEGLRLLRLADALKHVPLLRSASFTDANLQLLGYGLLLALLLRGRRQALPRQRTAIP